LARYRRAITHYWLLRSQPNPMQDTYLARRVFDRHRATIEADLLRMGLSNLIPDTIKEINNAERETNCATVLT
jgi:hypothetical protein